MRVGRESCCRLYASMLPVQVTKACHFLMPTGGLAFTSGEAALKGFVSSIPGVVGRARSGMFDHRNW